jgi:hypothetical protein
MKTARKKPAGSGTRVAAEESGPEAARREKAAPREKDAPRWRLPSGQTLAEFALRSGLLARRLMEPVRKSAARRDRADVRANA